MTMWLQKIVLLAIASSVLSGPVSVSVYQHSNGEQPQDYQPQYRPQQIQYKQQQQPQQQSRALYKQQEQDPRLLQQPESQDYEMEPPQPYQFSFDVADDENTNYQNRKEQREGNKISGSYSVVDSDGFIRTVTYTADPVEGFKAHVSREPTNIVVKLPTPAPQPQHSLDNQGIYSSAPKIQYDRAPTPKQIGVQYNGAPVPRTQLQTVGQQQLIAAAPRRQQTQQYLQGTQELVQYQPIYQQQVASHPSHSVTTAGQINQFLAETSPDSPQYNNPNARG